MKKMVILLIVFNLIAYNCYATDIKVDGDFSDWTDKPGYDVQSSDTVAGSVYATTTPTVVETPTPSVAETPVPSGSDTLTPSPQPLDNQTQMQVNNEQEVYDTSDNRIIQVKWHLSDEQDTLFIMTKISKSYSNLEETPGQYASNYLVSALVISDFGDFMFDAYYNIADGTVLVKRGDESLENSTGSCERVNKNQVEVEFGIPLNLVLEDMKWGYQIKFKAVTEQDEYPSNKYIIVSTASTGPFLGMGLTAVTCGGYYFIKRRKKLK